MPDVEAVSSSPTRGVPPIVGAPAAARFADGPATVAEGLFVSGLGSSPRVHTAPGRAQARSPGSVIVTSPSESGATVISHRFVVPVHPPRPSHLAPAHRERIVAQRPVADPDLLAERDPERERRPSVVLVGSPRNSAVSGSAVVAGAVATTSTALPVDRRRPAVVQTAPASAQSRPGGNTIPIAPAPDGVTVMLHRSARPSTCEAAVTVPPVTVSAWSRMSAALVATASLNAIRKVNAV